MIGDFFAGVYLITSLICTLLAVFIIVSAVREELACEREHNVYDCVVVPAFYTPAEVTE